MAPPPLSLPACKSAYSLACSLAYSLTYCHVFSPLSFFSFFPSDLVWHDLLHFVFPLCMRSSRCRLQLVQCIYLAHKTCFTCIFLFEGYDALSYDVYCFVLLFFLRYSSAPELLEPVLCPRTGFLAMSYRCNVRTLTCDLWPRLRSSWAIISTYLVWSCFRVSLLRWGYFAFEAQRERVNMERI